MNIKSLFAFIGCTVLLIILGTGCENTGNIANVSPQPAQPTTDTSGLSTEAVTTLNSLEMVDDYPLYVMQFAGDYDYPETASRQVGGGDYGCSLFTALGATADKLFGRNFDWEFSPALLIFTDPPDGFASASLVDLTFLGFTPEQAKGLLDLPLEERRDLLAAPSLPFDGMNEYGLAIGMTDVPDEYLDNATHDPSKPIIGSIGIIRQVLDHARNVDEALQIFGQYNIQSSEGPPLHYLLADPSGQAVLVEFYQGEMIVLPNENPWHMATNHLRCIAHGDGGCWRYHTLSERLSASSGILGTDSAMQLLAEVKQENTQWSAVYDMSNGDIHVVIGKEYSIPYTFHLELLGQ